MVWYVQCTYINSTICNVYIKLLHINHSSPTTQSTYTATQYGQRKFNSLLMASVYTLLYEVIFKLRQT